MTPGPEPESPSAPIKVMLLELESLPASVVMEPPYRGLWALVREHRRPRGVIKLHGVGSEVGAAELLGAVAELDPARPAPELAVPDQPPRVSVVVSTMYERRKDLVSCLESLARLNYPNYEVLLVDNRRQQTSEIPVSGVRLLHEPKPGLSNARNAGLAAADGEIVAFTDDDVQVDPSWLTAIVARLRTHPEEAGVTGIVMPIEIETDAQLAIETYYGSFGPRMAIATSHRLHTQLGQHPFSAATVDARDDRGQLLRSFPLYSAGLMGAGANMAIRAAVLEEIGGFDPILGPGTETQSAEDLAAFAQILWHGNSLGFEPAAIVHHRHRQDMVGLERQIEGYGIGLTALLLALIVDDPRHLGRMLGTAPDVVSEALGLYARRLKSGGSAAETSGGGRDARLAHLELRGMLRGPGAYLRSWHRVQRVRRRQGSS